MKSLRSRTAIVTGTILLAALGSTGVAVTANATSSPGTHVTTTEEPKGESSSEGAADQAAQDVACKAAGIPTTADDINFDDSTGVCTQGDGDGESNDD